MEWLGGWRVGEAEQGRKLPKGAGCRPLLCPWTGQEVVTDLGERRWLTELPSGPGWVGERKGPLPIPIPWCWA